MSTTTITLAQAVEVTQSKGGLALAIGSLATAEDGKYQSLVSSLEGNGRVERQMSDRLLDGGQSSPPASRVIGR